MSKGKNEDITKTVVTLLSNGSFDIYGDKMRVRIDLRLYNIIIIISLQIYPQPNMQPWPMSSEAIDTP